MHFGHEHDHAMVLSLFSAEWSPQKLNRLLQFLVMT